MLKQIQHTLILGLILMLALSCRITDDENVTLYKNGLIYNGETFEKKDFYVVDGRFSFTHHNAVMSVVDLENKYVIPPFADAHTHNFDDIEQFDSIYKAYVDEGTFYVQVLTNHYSNYLKIKDSINKPGKIDVSFAHGGVTSTGGHPHALYETRSMGMGWRAMLNPENKEKIRNSRREDNDAYYLLDSLGEVEKKWREIMSKDPSILKVYLSDFNNRDSEIEAGNIGTYGLTKEVSGAVIERAKKSDITVYAHIENVDDFTWALNHGITHFAHMPGYGGGFGAKDLTPYIIPDSTLQRAAQHKVVITPTVSFTKYYSQVWNGTEMALDSSLFEAKKEFLRVQLRRMYNQGVQLALGADQNGSTLMEEIDDIIDLKAFDNQELLEIILGTSKLIFPERKLGAIKEGYEGSFLVLEGNPLEAISALKNIHMRVKDGRHL